MCAAASAHTNPLCLFVCPQGTSVLSPCFHIGSVIILAMMIYKKSAVQLFEKHPCLYILAFGFVSAKITNKLVVSQTFSLVVDGVSPLKSLLLPQSSQCRENMEDSGHVEQHMEEPDVHIGS